jgi:hypothetical protein
VVTLYAGSLNKTTPNLVTVSESRGSLRIPDPPKFDGQRLSNGLLAVTIEDWLPDVRSKLDAEPRTSDTKKCTYVWSLLTGTAKSAMEARAKSDI